MHSSTDFIPMNNIYKAFSLVFLIVSVFNSAKATHVAGADITYECLGNDQYVITLNVFTLFSPDITFIKYVALGKLLVFILVIE